MFGFNALSVFSSRFADSNEILRISLILHYSQLVVFAALALVSSVAIAIQGTSISTVLLSNSWESNIAYPQVIYSVWHIYVDSRLSGDIVLSLQVSATGKSLWLIPRRAVTSLGGQKHSRASTNNSVSAVLRANTRSHTHLLNLNESCIWQPMEAKALEERVEQLGRKQASFLPPT